MKNKISTFLTELPGSAIQKQKNKKKRKEIYSDPNEDKILLKKRKYLATDVKPHVVTTISQVPAINNKVIKKKEKRLQPASTHSHCIEDIVGKDLKEEPPNTAGTVISEIEKFAVVPNSLPSYRTLFSSLKSKFNSPLPQLLKQRSTSTPIAGSERQKLHFDLEPLTPIKELIPSSLSKQTNLECGLISELPFQPITLVPKDKYKSLLTSEKLKLGILSKIPKFCPFCDYVCERMIYHHIETNHKDQLKLPIPTSLDAINKIISNFTKNRKVLVPLQRIVDIMGNYWFNPETRKIGNILCNLGQITAYGGSWELDHVSDVPNPFEQYIIKSNQHSE
ncbi:uncharacterized protein LOC114127356 isoform X3 [Aphis gossypii]|uniref:Uncharacterized protein n=2 Tax=Aphis gossypii TaxID=80765 RepID=A0A9P0J0M9_APHGO|nr:uncharacterized protein LOC114127356 isoform X3 [Aphis gossypii]CAH1723947.1 unnamed protein product [Aphis gossypii]